MVVTGTEARKMVLLWVEHIKIHSFLAMPHAFPKDRLGKIAICHKVGEKIGSG